MRTSIPKIAEFYTFLIHCSGIFGVKINIENTSENIKCGNLKGNGVISHNEEKRVTIWLVFMVILSNKIMQNCQNITPKRGKGNLPWWYGNVERVITIYACYMTPYISDFIPGSLVETDKCINVTDGHFVTAKQTWQVQIEMWYKNGRHLIATLYNVLLAPDLCDWLFSITALMNLGHICIFQNGFWTVSFSDN